MSDDSVYDLKSVQLPRLAGRSLVLLTSLVENPLGGSLLLPGLLRNAGVPLLGRLKLDEAPTPQPFHPLPEDGLPGAPVGDTLPELLEALAQASETAQPGFAFTSSQDYARVYRSGEITPEDVAQRVLQAIERSASQDGDRPALAIFIAWQQDDLLAQAQASARRWQDGTPLGPLDGVPVAVKDEIDQTHYRTNVGTSFLGQAPAAEDACVVERLRAAGALLIGKVNMHEIGIGVTGSNPHYGTPRNPYHTGHYTGGSSSGPAAAVAAGFCPLAVGADGGGSIRIPAAMCGVVGLKPTYGRVSEHGAAPLDWSVAHIGPLAATARDAALGYLLMAGPDRRDPNSLRQPPLRMDDFENLDLSALRLGVYRPWFDHATPEVVAHCERMLAGLQRLGAQVREVTIPELEAARVAHVVTISSEMAASMQPYDAEHRRDFSLETRLDLALARAMTSRDYVQAQRVRTRSMAHFQKALAQVDMILTPTTGVAAPPIPADALQDGESDLSLLTEIMRFVTCANLTGLPAISFPAGYTSQGLPVGMQAIGRPWQEGQLLRLAHAAETLVERRKPAVYFQLV